MVVPRQSVTFVKFVKDQHEVLGFSIIIIECDKMAPTDLGEIFLWY